MAVGCVAVTRGVVLLLFLLLFPPDSVEGGGVATVRHEHYKMDRDDHRALTEKHLLSKLQYYGDDSKLHEINMIEEVSSNEYYIPMAKLLGLNPDTIVNDYRLSAKEEEECSRRLLDKMYDRGYKKEFNWNAYIAGLRDAGGLNRIVKGLEDMLECNGISRKQQEAVTRSRFQCMTCEKDGSVLSLVEEVAPHWKAVARTFGIREGAIDSRVNIPERAAYVVLKRVYDNGYKGKLGWQGVLDLLQDAGVGGRVLSKLDKALNSVKHDEL